MGTQTWKFAQIVLVSISEITHAAAIMPIYMIIEPVGTLLRHIINIFRQGTEKMCRLNFTQPKTHMKNFPRC